jgi:hypothetical protein
VEAGLKAVGLVLTPSQQLQKMFLVLAKQYFKDINLEKHCKTMSK